MNLQLFVIGGKIRGPFHIGGVRGRVFPGGGRVQGRRVHALPRGRDWLEDHPLLRRRWCLLLLPHLDLHLVGVLCCVGDPFIGRVGRVHGYGAHLRLGDGCVRHAVRDIHVFLERVGHDVMRA